MKKSLVFMFCVLVLSFGLFAQSTFHGIWDFYFNWGCQPGQYSLVTITFNSSGTFATSEGFTGKWYQINDQLISWEYNTYGTTYSGTKVGFVMTGMMFYPAGNSTGCWYCVKKVIPSSGVKEAIQKPKQNSAGGKG